MPSLELNKNSHLCSLAIINAANSIVWQHVGGIPLVARSVYHFNAIGVKKLIVLISDDQSPKALDKWQGALQLHQVRLEGDIPNAILTEIGQAASFIYIDAAFLIDPRLICHLAYADTLTLAFQNHADIKNKKIRAGLMRQEDLITWAKRGDAAVIEHAQILLPDDIEPFCPETRGDRTPYFKAVLTPDQANKATRFLIADMQKKAMDLPSEYIDPHFENPLTMLLINTPVTPNMVTYVCLAVAIGVAWLFWHGHFITGALLTLAVEILDGVDGKLARTRLQFSKIGAHEDIIDYFYENSWYVALGVGLSHAVQSDWPLYIAGLLIFSDTADNIFYTLAGKQHGKSIDLFSPLDAIFRKIAGRRNIYGYMFIVGFLAGFPQHTFIAVAVWAFITAMVHGVRLWQYGRGKKRKTQ